MICPRCAKVTIQPSFFCLALPKFRQAVCNIYSAAIAAITQALPWIRAADVWHISSICDHKTVFKLNDDSTRCVQSPSSTSSSNNNNKTGTPRADNCGDASIGTLTSAESGSISGSHGGSVARFRERVVGKTWSGSPAVILRSLRAPGSYEAACAARWIRGNGEDGGSVFGKDEDWSDDRLRLLADEWKFCTGLDRTRRHGVAGGVGGLSADFETAAATPAAAAQEARVRRPSVAGVGSPGDLETAARETSAQTSSLCSVETTTGVGVLSPAGSGTTTAVTTSDPEGAAACPPPRGGSRPFMVHTGHLVVPFLNGRVREKGGGGRVGHGVVLAVDRGVDWKRWEPYLGEVADKATRCFERLESEGEAAEKARVKIWADKLLLRGGDDGSSGRPIDSER